MMVKVVGLETVRLGSGRERSDQQGRDGKDREHTAMHHTLHVSMVDMISAIANHSQQQLYATVYAAFNVGQWAACLEVNTTGSSA